MIKLVMSALLCASAFLPSIASAQCSGTQSTGKESLSIQSTYENVGVYVWNEGVQAWVLVHASYDPYFETERLKTGDTYIEPAAFWSGGGGGGGGAVLQGTDSATVNGPANSAHGNRNTGGPSIACDTPTTLPPVEVTGSRPEFGGSMVSMIWRGQMLNRSVGSGVVRRSMRTAQAKNTMTCSNSSEEERMLEARDVITRLGFMPQRSMVRVEYAPGNFQIWMVTQPSLTTLGLLPFGPCTQG